jgi:hypothetical protein
VALARARRSDMAGTTTAGKGTSVKPPANKDTNSPIAVHANEARQLVEQERAARPSRSSKAALPERYAKALEIRREKPKRGPGIAISDENLVQLIKDRIKAFPETNMKQELEIVYYIDQLRISRPRWVKAWAIATASATPEAKAS